MIDWTTILLAVIALVGSLGTAYFAYLAQSTAKAVKNAVTEAKEEVAETTTKLINIDTAIYELGVRVDGRLTQLLESTSVAAHAKGVIEGKTSVKPVSVDIKSMPSRQG